MSSTVPPARRGPDSLLLHLLQAATSLAATSEAETRATKMAAMLRGIQKYQRSLLPPITRPHTVVWQRGAARLLRLTTGSSQAKQTTRARRLERRRPVLLIPSLINGWEILDILPTETSFARDLLARGHDVYVIDWGDLRDDPEIATMSALLRTRLQPMVELLAGLSGQKIDLIGYCMGGLLMAGAYPFVQSWVDRLVFMATPWDFHAGEPHLTRLVRMLGPYLLMTVSTNAFLPNSRIQSLFALVDQDMAIAKYGRFATLPDDDPQARLFVGVEDWLQSGRDLPSDIARTCLQHWYLENRIAQGQWQVDGVAITAKLLSPSRSLVIAPRHDQLVEVQTAAALAETLGRHATLMTPNCGHIGLMTSPRAKGTVWAPLADWLN